MTLYHRCKYCRERYDLCACTSRDETPWRAYILECADGTLYTGATNDLDRRIRQHNEGKASKYTRGRLPVKLVWCGAPTLKGSALSEEASIKKLTRVQKQRMIRNARAVHA